MEQDDWKWLQKWYQNHCNGDWEHSNGVTIKTLDNPGWSININILDTELENKRFDKIHLERSEHDWIFCSVREDHFEGACGPSGLSEVLGIFRKWAENSH
jgi:hypothetical protein